MLNTFKVWSVFYLERAEISPVVILEEYEVSISPHLSLFFSKFLKFPELFPATFRLFFCILEGTSVLQIGAEVSPDADTSLFWTKSFWDATEDKE